MSSNGYVLHYELPALFGFFGELKPIENPVTTLVLQKGIRTIAEKVYGLTFHENYEASSLGDVNAKPDNSSPSYGSTGFTDGSNTVQVFDEGAADTFARRGDQRLNRTLGFRGPSNPSIEPNPMDRNIAEALERIKSGLEYVSREGTYTIPHAGTSAGTTGVWMQRGYRYSDGLTTGTADGGVISTAGGTGGTYGTLNKVSVIDTLQSVWEKRQWVNGPLLAVCNAIPKRQLSDIMSSEYNFGKNGESVNVAGVNLTRFLTDFGIVDILLTHNWPANELYFLNMDFMEIVARPVPGEENGGLLFERNIAQVTAAIAKSIYGEIGMNYQTGSAHGRIPGIGSTVQGGQSIS